MYLVVAIMGIEYTLNFGDPKIDGYCSWLLKNDHKSPLFDPAEKILVNQRFNKWREGDSLNFVTR